MKVYNDSCWVAKSCLSFQPHGPQNARLPCPSSPGACSISCPLSWWCHSTISSSITTFSSCPQSFPASGTEWVLLGTPAPHHYPTCLLLWTKKASPLSVNRGCCGHWDSGWESRGCWSQVAEVHIRGVSSISPVLASSRIHKSAKFINLRYVILFN